jgi:hypothetical protein
MNYRYYKPCEIIAIRSKKIALLEAGAIEHYLNNLPGVARSGYVDELYNLTLSQLINKAGFDVKIFPGGIIKAEQERLELLAERLTIHSLKRKLGRIKKPEPLAFKSGSELLDPHHHLNSIYLQDNPQLLHLLPDFNAIYIELRSVIKNPLREIELRSQEGIVTDVQFIGNPPSNVNNPLDGRKKLNQTVGWVNDYHNSTLKENAMKNHVQRLGKQNKDTHRDDCLCCDICGPEKKDSWKGLEAFLNHSIEHNARIIRFHIGETHIPAHGKENVERLFDLLDSKRAKKKLTNQIIRLGHATHMGIESMKDCAQHGYYVEACLSSNKETGIITKRKEYPLGVMLLLDVKVMLGTDGGDAYYTDLKTEYAYAKKVLNHFIMKINKERDELIQLPNGDYLQYKHIKHLFKNVTQLPNWEDSKLIRYNDLKPIEKICIQKISVHTLVDTINEFKGKMFSEKSNKALLENEPETTDFPPPKIPSPTTPSTAKANPSQPAPDTSAKKNEAPLPPTKSNPTFFKTKHNSSAKSKAGNQPISSLSSNQLEKINALKMRLQKEINSCWLYPNKDRKQIKIDALLVLIEYAEKLSITEAVEQVMANYKLAIKGKLSTRTADLFSELIAEDRPFNKGQTASLS